MWAGHVRLQISTPGVVVTRAPRQALCNNHSECCVTIGRMMHARRRLAVVLVALAAAFSASPPLVAQQSYRSSIPLPSKWSQGYVKTVSGDVLVYPWAYPGQVERS